MDDAPVVFENSGNQRYSYYGLVGSKHTYGKNYWTHNERVIKQAIDDIELICDQLKLPTFITQSSFDLFKQCYNDKLTKGRSYDALILACIYAVCLENKVFRNKKDFLDETMKPATFTKMLRLLCEKYLSPIDYYSYDIWRYCERLRITEYYSDIKQFLACSELKFSKGLLGAVMLKISEEKGRKVRLSAVSKVLNTHQHNILSKLKEVSK